MPRPISAYIKIEQGTPEHTRFFKRKQNAERISGVEISNRKFIEARLEFGMDVWEHLGPDAAAKLHQQAKTDDQ